MENNEVLADEKEKMYGDEDRKLNVNTGFVTQANEKGLVEPNQMRANWPAARRLSQNNMILYYIAGSGLRP